MTYYDGKDVVSVVNGKETPTPPKVKGQLEYELKDGVYQESVALRFQNKENEVLYRGKEKLEGKEYEVFETKDVRGKKETLYFDPITFRKMVEVRIDVNGETQMIVTEAFAEYEGVLYEKNVTFKNLEGGVEGSGRVVEVTKDFDDSVFTPPSRGTRESI